MKVVQCKMGHYYDAEKYDECPMCKKNQEAQEKNNTAKTENKVEEKKQNSNFGIQQNEVDLSQLEECKNATTITAVDKVSEPSTMRPNENISQEIDDYKMHHLRPNDGETLVNFGDIAPNKGTDGSRNEPLRPDDNGETQIEFGSFFQQETPVKKTIEVKNTVSQKPVRPDDNGETQVGFGSFKIDSVVQAPPANSGTRKNNGPVVGWLVAVKGPHIGQSFELFPKKNFIGRNDSLIVNLYNDKTVSRTAPLSVIFNRHNNKFMAMSGNSDQTAYINDDLLLQPIELKENDKIDIGNTRLLFIPLLKNGESVESIYKVD